MNLWKNPRRLLRDHTKCKTQQARATARVVAYICTRGKRSGFFLRISKNNTIVVGPKEIADIPLLEQY